MLEQWVGKAAADYYNVVWRAVIDSRVFATFRRDKAYTGVLEHVTQTEGRTYLDSIRHARVRELCLNSEHADTIGEPSVYQYEGKALSPTTLRYARVLSDILDIFPKIHGSRRLVEIGIGYGGQARLFQELLAPPAGVMECYSLVDILPVILLARLYLESFPLRADCEYLTKSIIPTQARWDFAISNYAFSEFSRELQDEYIRLVLAKSESGYLTMNSGLVPHPLYRHGHRAEELLEILPAAVLLEEAPPTAPGNYILVYGDHNRGAGVPLATLREKAAKASAQSVSLASRVRRRIRNG